jgi:hypothetical protein
MTNSTTDLLCFGADWDLASTHHALLARLADERRVFFIEAPRFSNSHPYMPLRSIRPRVWSARPYLTMDTSPREQHFQLCGQLGLLALDMRIVRPVIWYLEDGLWPAMPQIAASHMLCGPVKVASSDSSAAWHELLAHAEVVLGDEATPVEHELTDAFPSGLLPSLNAHKSTGSDWQRESVF